MRILLLSLLLIVSCTHAVALSVVPLRTPHSRVGWSSWQSSAQTASRTPQPEIFLLEPKRTTPTTTSCWLGISDEDKDGWDDESSSMEPLPPPVTEPDRDLFIPIFTLVSLTGLVGAYGYEMARLYSQGQLYLPWEQ
uniref:Uncharacterized protein n=1 Tax=Attheya septentrionalis TaxID=420275 RepID=A0A7S2UBS4_9STRA|mmetsp:Transcript_17245/g.31157  ORF Transcript_17245/g.31157 Transcript_17245/m.31157 type:complete len:137 (+) Transcript_17245:215-625(+)|eukprot:CAMPEP_0198297496 /NCGR_PEP_ID=MMETSP1449-20131203/36945_1 /TAXON_ID=420275 /ORGANISM="Attheya septentrionalis, Strain CCMP2084" /LENGTH=136 /DNA_ID=CAMNT_0043998431 /DNA_START=207 /DNA_END=617 /DNA_ORIENTATION=-